VTRPFSCIVALGFCIVAWMLVLLVAAFLLPGPW
jgi:hypothetical protein